MSAQDLPTVPDEAMEAARRIVAAADGMSGCVGADRRAALKRLDAAMRDEYGIIQIAHALLSRRSLPELDAAKRIVDRLRTTRPADAFVVMADAADYIESSLSRTQGTGKLGIRALKAEATTPTKENT